MRNIAFVLAVTCIGALVGCANPAIDRSRAYVNAGNCRAADAEIQRSGESPSVIATTMGLIQLDCYKNMPAAIRYFNLGARYGHPTAQQVLTHYGQPVPPADLQRAPVPGALDALADAAQEYGRPRSTAPAATVRPLPRTCRSSVTGTLVNTTCD